MVQLRGNSRSSPLSDFACTPSRDTMSTTTGLREASRSDGHEGEEKKDGIREERERERWIRQRRVSNLVPRQKSTLRLDYRDSLLSRRVYRVGYVILLF